MRPRTTDTPAAPPAGRQLSRRQYVRFAFYKLDPTWRRLSDDEQAAQKRELSSVIQNFNRRMLLRPYSTVGTRADCELLLWQIAESPLVFQELATAILRTRMGSYLQIVYSYFSQTKRSVYEIRVGGDDGSEEEERLVIDPSEAKYVFVYPFIKTRPWYLLSKHARQGVMDEHIEVGKKFPSIRLNTTYSFGIDDYEFILAFETDEPADFLDLVQELRETESSRYTLQDTPLFTCVNLRLDEALDALGGPPIAEALAAGEARESWVEVCALADFEPGQTRSIFLEGKMVGIFNIKGEIFAINNRCSHARGPLCEGTIDSDECSVVCPWHYGKFDIKTGAAIDGVVKKPVETFQTKIENGMVWVGTKIS
ncbi:chlorite dismutase family protein [Armatimonas sp.]|uniref:chlorite dismutase family protein n=1 Tax=Armatimonas sp. TaxID=1872638 RepID=UPI00286BBF92|nr:chlorite dismutase family protein [Armatimonas sp.]